MSRIIVVLADSRQAKKGNIVRVPSLHKILHLQHHARTGSSLLRGSVNPSVKVRWKFIVLVWYPRERIDES
jgi:hypothetical protein